MRLRFFVFLFLGVIVMSLVGATEYSSGAYQLSSVSSGFSPYTVQVTNLRTTSQAGCFLSVYGSNQNNPIYFIARDNDCTSTSYGSYNRLSFPLATMVSSASSTGISVGAVFPVSFRKVYDVNGNYIQFEPATQFPATTYTFVVKSPTGVPIESYTYTFAPGSTVPTLNKVTHQTTPHKFTFSILPTSNVLLLNGLTNLPSGQEGMLVNYFGSSVGTNNGFPILYWKDYTGSKKFAGFGYNDQNKLALPQNIYADGLIEYMQVTRNSYFFLSGMLTETGNEYISPEKSLESGSKVDVGVQLSPKPTWYCRLFRIGC